MAGKGLCGAEEEEGGGEVETRTKQHGRNSRTSQRNKVFGGARKLGKTASIAWIPRLRGGNYGFVLRRESGQEEDTDTVNTSMG